MQDTPPPLPRTPFPWKFVTIAAALVVVFGFLVFGAIFGWRTMTGQREWTRVKHDLLARGEKLTLVELAPEPVPAEDNFYADPLWEELHASGTGQNPGEPSLQKGKRQLDLLSPPITSPNYQKVAADYPDLSVSGTTVRGVLLKLIGDKEAEAARQRRAAEFILATLKEPEPILTRVTELAKRPDSCFPLNYDEGVAMHLNHLTYLLNLGQIFRIRTWAEISLGNREAALADTLTLLRLTKVSAREPILISQLVRVAMASLAIAAIRDGITAHAWSDADLAAFEHDLASINLVPDLMLALRGERGSFNQIADSLRKSPGEIRRLIEGTQAGPPDAEDRMGALGAGIFLRTFFSADQAFFNQLIQQCVDNLDRATEDGLTPKSMPEDAVKNLSKGPVLVKFRNFLSLLMLPALSGAGRRFADAQDQIRMTRVACALERYRLRHGCYPDTLDALTPDFLPALPVDVVTLKPIRYRTGEKEGFLLWTPGWNEKDDGGKPADRKTNDGDWIWGR